MLALLGVMNNHIFSSSKHLYRKFKLATYFSRQYLNHFVHAKKLPFDVKFIVLNKSLKFETLDRLWLIWCMQIKKQSAEFLWLVLPTYIPTYKPTYIPTYYLHTYLLPKYLPTTYIPTYYLHTYLLPTDQPTTYIPTYYLHTHTYLLPTYLPTNLSFKCSLLMPGMWILASYHQTYDHYYS